MSFGSVRPKAPRGLRPCCPPTKGETTMYECVIERWRNRTRELSSTMMRDRLEMNMIDPNEVFLNILLILSENRNSSLWTPFLFVWLVVFCFMLSILFYFILTSRAGLECCLLQRRGCV